MSVSTYPVAWPIQQRLEGILQSLQDGFNEIEAVTHELKAAIDHFDDGADIDPLPTFETVGRVWSFLDGLRMEIDQLTGQADEVESQLGEIERIRRDSALERGESDVS